MRIVKNLNILSYVVFIILCFFIYQTGFSQTLAEMEAAQNMNDNLNATSVGTAPQSSKDSVGAEGPLGYAGEEFPGMMGMQVTPTPTPFIEMVKVLHGKRIRCKIPTCNSILEDARYEEMPKLQVLAQPDTYFNDGTHGDVDPNDSIYTNIEEDNNWMCPKCNLIKEYLIALLVYVDSLSPREFFLLMATTSELISTVPKDITEEELKDEENISRWLSDFLAPYRTDPHDVRSTFIPLYVPLPPELPVEPLPQNFAQLVSPGAGQPGGMQGGGGQSLLGPGGEFLEGGVTGEPQGNAMSNYYDASKLK